MRSYRLVPPRSRARKVLEIDGDGEKMRGSGRGVDH